ncbi:MAG: hypothetical protein ACHQ3P_09955 [Candidatus Limnocylindrales bacterium]
MTWYLQHQRAREIIAEHEREAQRIRLARLARGDAKSRPRRTGIVRRTAARPVAFVGRSATRLAQALDAERGSATAGRSSDSATLRLDRNHVPPRI